MKSEHEQRIHEQLCAYVLGELESASERAEIEALLAASPELRAEQARLAATIGLVQGALGGPESAALPESSRAALSAAAARGRQGEDLAQRTIPAVPPRRWWKHPALQLAAAASVLGIVWAGWGASREGTSEVTGTVAMLEGGAQSKDDAAQLVEERALGKRGASVEPAASAPAAEYLGRAELESAARAMAGTEQDRVAKAAAELGVDLDYYKSPKIHDLLLMEDLSEQKAPFQGPSDTAPPATVRRDELAGLAYNGGADAQVGLKEEMIAGLGYTAGSGAPAAAPPSAPVTGGVYGVGTGGQYGSGIPSFNRLSGTARRKNPEPQGPAGPGLAGPAREVQPGDFFLGSGEGAEFREVDSEDYLRTNLPWDQQVDLVLSQCRQLPGETPDAMFFRFWGDNPFMLTTFDRLSTFAADADTASYALARSYLKQGILPAKEQVRTEEFVNYFKPDVPAPVEGPFAIVLESAPSLFGGAPERSLLRVAVRGRDVAKHERKPLALTFVVDVSGSMKQGNRLELVKHALRLLSGELGARDALGIVAFSTEARQVLPPTSAGNRGLVESAIYGLQPAGGTNAEAGLRMGYEQAVLQFDAEAVNRVVLLSDGVANVGQTDQQRLTDEVATQRARGIYLNTVGVGMGNHNDVLLEQLADKGDGLCNYVDSPEEAKRALVDNFTGAFETIARDVKIQVEFDPRSVESWRQIGYENRAVADQDFRKDEVDAGEIGAGHQVEALYEIVRVPTTEPAPLATVRLRYKAPHGERLEDALPEQAMELERTLRTDQESGSYSGTSPGYRRATLVAEFAELLRRSVHARGDSLDTLIAAAEQLAPELEDPDFNEFVALAKQSRELVLRTQQRNDPLLDAVDAIRENRFLQAQLTQLQQDSDRELVSEIEARNRELEQRIRELLRERSQR